MTRSETEEALAWLDQGGRDFYELDGVERHWSCGIAMLGFCGCGDPPAAAEYLLTVLREFEDDGPRGGEDSTVHQLPWGAYWMVLYWLDKRDWIEHGSGLRGAWLTDTGKLAIRVLEAMLRLEEVTS